MSRKKNLSENDFLKAQKYYSDGNFFDAIKLYKKISKQYPNEKNVLNKIAQIYIQSNSPEEGIEYFKKSLLIDPLQHELYENLGVASYQINDYKNALEYFNKSIQVNKTNPNTYFNRGLVFKSMGLHDAAVEDFKFSVAIDPKNYENLKEIVLILNTMNKYNEVVKFSDLAIQVKSGDPTILFVKAQALNKLNKFEEALEIFVEIAKLNFTSPDILIEEGFSYFKLNRYDDALSSFNKLIERDPKNALAFNNKGQALFRLQKFSEALESYDTAIKINPNLANTYVSKAEYFTNFGHYYQAIENLTKAINLNKDLPVAYFNLGVIQLHTCDFKNGWKNYEYRLGMPQQSKANIINSIFGKKFSELGSVFLAREQGIGDQIIYASLFHEFSINKNEVDIEIDKRLLPIFRRSFPDLNFLSRDAIGKTKSYDNQMALGSLPSFFRKDINSFENQKKYFLKSDQIKRSLLRKRLLAGKNSKRILGLSWFSANSIIGKDKSIDPIYFKNVLKIPNIEFVSLQYNHPNNRVGEFLNHQELGIRDFQDLDLYNDIDSMFSLVDACDYVITISNVTAHIAGSLGKKTYLLIPRSIGNLWYWHKDMRRSLWYPSIEVFFQSDQSNWIDPINEIISKISSNINHYE